MQSLYFFSIFFFFGDEIKILQALFTCGFIPRLLLHFRIEEKIHSKTVANVSRSADSAAVLEVVLPAGEIFETMVSSKILQEDLGQNFIMAVCIVLF